MHGWRNKGKRQCGRVLQAEQEVIACDFRLPLTDGIAPLAGSQDMAFAAGLEATVG